MQRRERRGVYALEFALTFPVWFMLIVAVADLSWMYMHIAVLDYAASVGCRTGAIIDPGDFDTNITEVTLAATERMGEIMDTYGLVDMDDYTLDAHTEDAPPTRVLVCNASWVVEPVLGVFWSTTTFHAREVARLEWQREAAP